MPRPKSFNPAHAVSCAVDLFWERGYEATSVNDLRERLGLSKSSLYATFGDKHALYLAALDHYRESSLPILEELVTGPGSPLQRLSNFLREVALGEGAQRGCFNVNAATELGDRDSAAVAKVELAWRHLEEATADLLRQARAADEISSDADVPALAAFVVTAMQGLRVVARANAASPLLGPSVEVLISTIVGGHHTD